MRAIVVDKDYGSVTPQELDRVAAAYQAAGIQMELLEYQVEATRQKEPTEEEIIAGCQGAQVLLATGNPPITRKVMETLPEVKFVQRFGAGVNSIDLAAAAELGVIVLNLPGFCAKELADVAIYLLGLAEILDVDLGKEVRRKMDINRRRRYGVVDGVWQRLEDGSPGENA